MAFVSETKLLVYNEFWALKLNQRGTRHMGPMLIQFQGPKLIIVAVSFFGNASVHPIFSLEFDPSLRANNSGLNHLTPYMPYIF